MYSDLSAYKESMHDMGLYTDFLSQEEEQQLAQDVSACLQMMEWIFNVPSSIVPWGLIILAKGFHSHQILVERNLRLVIDMAHKMQSRSHSIMDLVQEGNKGLMRAAWKYRPNYEGGSNGQPIKFSTYATFWIRQAISRYIKTDRALSRLPVHLAEKMPTIKRYIEEYHQEFGHNPSVQHLAKHFHVNRRSLEAALTLSEDPFSLDEFARSKGGYEERTLADIIPDPSSLEEPDFFAEADKAVVEVMLSFIKNERDRDLLKYRYGFTTGRKMTLEETGDHFGVTRERARQIEANTLRFIRGKLKITQEDAYEQWLERAVPSPRR